VTKLAITTIKQAILTLGGITFRNDPIYRGALTGIAKPGGAICEDIIVHNVGLSAIMWNTLELQDIPGILDIVPAPITVVKIHKIYQGQPRQVAAALWGSRLPINMVKMVMVVEEDVDIYNPNALLRAMLLHVDPAKNLIVFPMGLGTSLDPALSPEAQDEMRYGAGLQNKLLIDATVDWTTHPVKADWGGRRLPPSCTEPLPELVELVQKRWQGFSTTWW